MTLILSRVSFKYLKFLSAERIIVEHWPVITVYILTEVILSVSLILYQCLIVEHWPVITVYILTEVILSVSLILYLCLVLSLSFSLSLSLSLTHYLSLCFLLSPLASSSSFREYSSVLLYWTSRLEDTHEQEGESAPHEKVNLVVLLNIDFYILSFFDMWFLSLPHLFYSLLFFSTS